VAPAAGVGDRLLAPQAGGAVEVDEQPGAGAGQAFHHEVAIEEQGLGAGQQGVVAVEVGPASLHDCHPRVGEVMHRALEKVGMGHEVGVEDGHDVGLGGAQPVLQRAGFEAATVGSVDVLHVEAAVGPVRHRLLHDAHRLVGGIVQDLNVELVFGVVQLAGGVEDPGAHVHLVVHGELHRDHGQFIEMARRRHPIVAVLAEEVEVVKPTQPVGAQEDKDTEVDEQNDQVEQLGAVQEREVAALQEFFVAARRQAMAERVSEHRLLIRMD